MEGGAVSEAMQQGVGRELRRMTSLPVSEGDIRRWASAVSFPALPPDRYWGAPAGGPPTVAPEDFNPFSGLIAEPRGWAPRLTDYEQWIEGTLGIVPPVTYGVAMNGTVHTLYAGVPVRAGDVISAVETLAGYRVTSDQGGHRLLLTTTRAQWSNQSGLAVKEELRTVVRFLDEVDQRHPAVPEQEGRRAATGKPEFGPFVRHASLEAWNRFAAANDELYDIHMDHVVAVERGLPGPIGLGSQLLAYSHAAVRSWLPDRAFASATCRLRAPWRLGSTVEVHGRVVLAEETGAEETGADVTGADVSEGVSLAVQVVDDRGLTLASCRFCLS